jgi:Flp pilus assembly protein TadG
MKRVHNCCERGAVLVELAIILPLLVTMFLIILDLGFVLREHQIVQNAAREGAHFSALPANWVNPTNPTASVDAIKQLVIGYTAQEHITIDSSQITVNQQYPITVGTSTVRGSQVTVTYTRPLFIDGTPLLPNPQITLTGQSVFRNLY